MPSQSQHPVVPIDREWAVSVVGLRMQVPEHWWPGYSGSKLCAGKIVAVDFDEPAGRYFTLRLDADEDEDDEIVFSMRYDAVVHYADEQHERYASFKLPPEALADPQREEVRLSRPRSLPQRRIFHSSSPTTGDNGIASSNEDEEASEEEEEFAVYARTLPEDWKEIKGRARGRTIEPIPFTGDNDTFSVKMTDEELESVKDKSGDIRFERIFEWLLPRFGEDGAIDFWEFLAARMRNYMIHIMRAKDFKPKFYNPKPVDILDKTTIRADHVARFFGCHIARMLRGFPSIDETWSTRESLRSIGAVKDSMPQDAYKDIYRCMHFSDDWEEEEENVAWDSVYDDPKYAPSPDAAKHRKKFEHIEDGFNSRWKECVNFGRWLTADESRVAGWYNSVITVGPEPKPIRTGATIHSLCVTHGPLASYKLHCRVYGGSTDGDLNKTHNNTATTQKWVNLYCGMLDEFKGNGHCCTMDSAYMGDIMGQIGREEWKMNFVGTAQSNRTGADVEEVKKSMKKGTYESALFQHNSKPLVYALW